MYFLKNTEKMPKKCWKNAKKNSYNDDQISFFPLTKIHICCCQLQRSNITNDEKMGTIFYQLTLKKLAILYVYL